MCSSDLSNVTDLAKWLLCRLDSGRYAGGRLFSERQAREMWTGQTILPIGDPEAPLAALRPSFSEYGLGWRLRDYQGRKIVSHTGGLAGMSSQVTLVPAAKLGIVILTNSEADLMAALTYRLLDDLLGAPRPRSDWVAAFGEAGRLARARADSTLRATQYDTFIARWRTQHIEDAYVTFALTPDGAIDRFDMMPVSPLADFSFDYQDLLFRPVPATRGSAR